MNESLNKPSISYETGLDEAYLIGTRDELIEFANSIIVAAQATNSTQELHGIKTHQTSGRLNEPMGDVVLENIIVVENTNDRKELMNQIRINNGETEIAWDQ